MAGTLQLPVTPVAAFPKKVICIGGVMAPSYPWNEYLSSKEGFGQLYGIEAAMAAEGLFAFFNAYTLNNLVAAQFEGSDAEAHFETNGFGSFSYRGGPMICAELNSKMLTNPMHFSLNNFTYQLGGQKMHVLAFGSVKTHLGAVKPINVELVYTQSSTACWVIRLLNVKLG